MLHSGMFMSKLIHWCKDQVEGYGIEVKDMSTSWKSGLALCAIINRYEFATILFLITDAGIAIEFTP